MSEPDSSEKPWSNNPNAPQIPYSWYLAEKTTFAGILISAILYGAPTHMSVYLPSPTQPIIVGITVVLFFQCMGALLNSVNHARRSVKWGLIAHTTTMFLFVTIYTATTLDILSITHIDNRNFPGVNGVLPPGPVGYGLFALSNPIGIVPAVMFLLNNWLADGLLVSFAPNSDVWMPNNMVLLQLHRCSVIYAMKYWVIAFPCLIYLASVGTYFRTFMTRLPDDIANTAMGIVFIHQTSQLGGSSDSLAISTGVPYFSISISLNVLLTLMIVTRLVLHRRNIQRALGAQAGKSGVYTAVVTILIESSALYAITSLLFVVPWGVGSRVAQIFLPALAQTQVCPVFPFP